MASNDTLSAGSFNLILLAIGQSGADTGALCRAVGVDPALLTNPDARIPLRAVQDLWHESVVMTGDRFLPLRLGELVNPLSLGVLAYVMMHCPTLGHAFDKLCQYQDIVCEGVRTAGRKEGGRFVLSLTITSPEIRYPDYTLGSELSLYIPTIRTLIGRPFTPEEIRFSYPRPADLSVYNRVFAGADLIFDAQETQLILNMAWLETPILNANPSLFPVFEQHAVELLRRLRQPDLIFRVKKEILGLLKGEEPTLATVADRLAVGVRTLQLHLKEKGVTYRQLLDEVRQELAVRHLRDPYLSTIDIAYLLGFSEPSVFYRSFKKWTGSTPGAFREGRAVAH
ncbi:AraC family transcriptional regulator [Larkinella soli]|uniref:AraC family transcriptional regulator n=1 Tax=Larkinella soli TaxID=1770527 RepID=UPI000FFB308A|nr:AraC family transcriptional regulator [Larkinella soli]